MLRIPDAVHQELLNWSRACWIGDWPHPLPSTKCGSLEAQYRAPPEWDEDLAEAPPPPYIRPNMERARVVQGVYDELDMETRRVLKAEYPCHRDHRNRTAAAHKLGLTIYTYEILLAHAVNRVEAAFEVCD